MKRIPLDIFPTVLWDTFGVPRNGDHFRAEGRLSNRGLKFRLSWTVPYETDGGVITIGDYIWRYGSPVTIAKLCGWVLPLKSSTPAGVVADYLLDKGQEDTNLYRLLMWFHWLGNEEAA